MLIRLLVIVLLAAPLWSQTAKTLVHKYQKREVLKNAQWSVYARYIDSGKVIVDHNSGYSLTPASGLKLFSTATALDVLGPDFRFKTRLYMNGHLKDGLLEGDIIIVGGGDPTLGSARIEGSLPLDSLMLDWLGAIKSAGIKEVSGQIIGYAGLYEEQSTPGYWYWIDLGNYYGAGSHALNINENLYHLYFKPSARVGGEARVIKTEPHIPGLTFTNNMKTGPKGSGDRGYIYCAPGQFNATLRGTIPKGKSQFSIKGSIPAPALFTAQLLKEKLEESGISVKKKASESRKNFNFKAENFFHTTYSPFLKEIVYIVNKRSHNLYAEAIAKMAGLQSFKKGSNKNAVKAIGAFLERAQIEQTIDLYDACGLSPSNTITTKSAVDLLNTMYQHSSFPAFYNSLAVAGDKDDIGYFSSWGKGTAIAHNVRVKSGTINRVKSHSGYLKDSKGRMIAFSMIANNYKGSVKKINSIHKKILIALAKAR